MPKIMEKAALYLRSSKDRSDVSIAAQRRELEALALSRGFHMEKEYADVVESAKSVNRPQFQALLTDLKNKKRAWNTLLLLDTARLSRRRFHAQAFKHQAKKNNVEIIYAKLPDLDPITSVIVESVFEAMDEVHSLMSKEKGLAGMAENVRQGYRAGGRAPYGYTLKKIETGAIRDGAPVTKSVLETDPLIAPRLSKYLSARANGVSRTVAQDDADIKKAKTTLIGMSGML